jgi:hypothetical protein
VREAGAIANRTRLEAQQGNIVWRRVRVGHRRRARKKELVEERETENRLSTDLLLSGDEVYHPFSLAMKL